MKTKRTVFEVNDVYRVMENSELIYVLTNSEKLKHEEYKYIANFWLPIITLLGVVHDLFGKYLIIISYLFSILKKLG